MNIVLLGSPGSGKGTQAQMIAKKYNLFYLQTGAVARELAKTSTRIKEIVESGKLIPEEEMTMHVLDFLKTNSGNLTNILFEGFPRFVLQYEALSNFLQEKGDDIDLVLSLDLTEEEAIKRVTSRRICSVCGEVYNLITNPPVSEATCVCGGKLIQREDDNPESISVRFKDYTENTKVLIDYLDKKGLLTRVDGNRPIEVIFREITSIIDKVA